MKNSTKKILDLESPKMMLKYQGLIKKYLIFPFMTHRTELALNSSTNLDYLKGQRKFNELDMRKFLFLQLPKL